MKIQCLNGDIHCVYTHSKKDGSIFYVGMGLPSRPFNCFSRSDKWKEVASETGFKVSIIEDYISEDEAYELEEFLISELRESGEKLVNISEGGKGWRGSKHSDQSKLKISKALSNHNRSIEHCKAISKAKKGVTVQKKCKKVQCIDTGEIFESASKASKMLNVSLSGVSLAANGKRKTNGGYRFKYINEAD